MSDDDFLQERARWRALREGARIPKRRFGRLVNLALQRDDEPLLPRRWRGARGLVARYGWPAVLEAAERVARGE